MFLFPSFLHAASLSWLFRNQVSITPEHTCEWPCSNCHHSLVLTFTDRHVLAFGISPMVLGSSLSFSKLRIHKKQGATALKNTNIITFQTPPFAVFFTSFCILAPVSKGWQNIIENYIVQLQLGSYLLQYKLLYRETSQVTLTCVLLFLLHQSSLQHWSGSTLCLGLWQWTEQYWFCQLQGDHKNTKSSPGWILAAGWLQ